MKLKIGTTRFVFLIGNTAYKWPIIPIFLFLKRLHKHTMKGDVNETINKHGSSFVFRYLLRGFTSNYLEYKYSKENPRKEDIIPSTLIWGFIIKQPRGHRFSIHQQGWKNILCKLAEKEIKDPELLNEKNYSVYRDRIRLHDYGNPGTADNLLKIAIA